MTSVQHKEQFSQLLLQLGDSKLSEENGKICIPSNLWETMTNFKSFTCGGIQDLTIYIGKKSWLAPGFRLFLKQYSEALVKENQCSSLTYL